MTQIFILFATAIGALLLTDPFFAGALTKAGFAKGAIYVLGFGALAFHCLGRAIVAPERLGAAAREVLAESWPLLLFAALVLGGSAYGRFVDGVQESFINVGLGLLFMPMFALAVRASERPMVFMKWFAALYIVMVVATFAVLYAGIHLFHESIFLVVPFGLVLLLSREFQVWRVLLGLALIGACLYSFKNTTFLLVLTSLAAGGAVWAARVARVENRLAVVVALLALVPLVLIGSAVAGWQWWQNRELLPSGNVEYRQEMYGIAWRAFLASPVWGTLFTDSSVVYFRLYQVATSTQWLPTHSDVLDLLAHGGVIAFTLWLLIVWRQWRMTWQAGRVLAACPTDVQLAPYLWLFMLGMIQIGGVITYAINPVMISPVYAFWMWGAAGVQWALHRELAAEPLPVRMTYRAMLRQQVLSR